MPLNDGEIFAGFSIIRLLGSGGMGEVYLAQHPRLPRRDALENPPCRRVRRPGVPHPIQPRSRPSGDAVPPPHRRPPRPR